MYISGCVIQRPRVPKTKPRDERPFSSELPYLQDLRSLSHNKGLHKVDAARTSSHCKVPVSKHRTHIPNSLPPPKPTSDTKIDLKKRTPKLVSDNVKMSENGKLAAEKAKLFSQNMKTGGYNTKIGSQSALTQCQHPQFKLSLHFRYYPLMIIGACGMREELMQSLMERGELEVYNPGKRKLAQKNVEQIVGKLQKLANLRGKYKYRQKFNVAYSAQLRALGYKRKEQKKKKESSSSEEEDEGEKREKCRDMTTWKKVMGVEESKVFIVKGKYKDFREALLARGWVENQDKHSTFYDLKWTTKVSDVNFDSLRPNQIVNHFNNNACLTSKYGLCKSLRSIMLAENIDVDAFFPKAYDLCDQSDFENFLEVYKWIYCESVLKKYLSSEQLKEKHTLQYKQKDTVQCKEMDVLWVLISLMVTERRLLSLTLNVAHTLNSRFNLCSINEWNCLKGEKYEKGQIEDSLMKWGLGSKVDVEERVTKTLSKLKHMEPQYELNHDGNIWIVKPAFLSRGRGIKCMVGLEDILDYVLGKETQYVVQKYIENPLIIHGKKFDIRQWVIVEDYNPPKIWVYGEFYVRFCLEDYNPAKINNKFAHLTNNSIQKHNAKISASELAKESMWTQDELKAYIEQRFGENAFGVILSKMKEVIVATILSTQDQVYGRKNSFELIGYDFMIDDRLQPWLIEINSSPSMDYSTPVTKRLVKMVLQDTCKVVLDLKKKRSKKKTAGMFKCVYQGEGDFQFKHYALPNPIKPQMI